MGDLPQVQLLLVLSEYTGNSGTTR